MWYARNLISYIIWLWHCAAYYLNSHVRTIVYWNQQLFVTISETNSSEIISGKKQRGIARQLQAGRSNNMSADNIRYDVI